MKRMFTSGLLLSLLSGCHSPAPAEAPEKPTPAETPVTKKADPRYQELPGPGRRPDFTAPLAQKKELENGLNVWQMPHGSAPLVSIYLVLSTGAASDPQGKAGLTNLAADLLDEGAGKRNAIELDDELMRLATEYSASTDLDYVLLNMSALSENLEPSLALLADIVQRPKLDAKEFERRREQHVSTAIAAADDPRHARNRALSHALFGGGYGSQSVDGTAESLKGMKLLDVRNRVKQLAVPEDAHLVVAGQFDPEVVNALAQKYFGNWKGKRVAAAPKLDNEPSGGVAYVVDFPGAAQTSLVVARRAGENSDPNYFAEEVMNDRLGGSFTGRINMNLREDKGYTYGASSVFRRYRHAGYFGVYSDVVSEATAASVSEVFKELQAVCGARPLTDTERNEAVEGMLLGFPMGFADVSSMGSKLASLPVRQRPVDFWQLWPEQIAAITTERANEAAQPYCDPSQFSVVLAGDTAKWKGELSQLGLSITLLDREGQPVVEKQP